MKRMHVVGFSGMVALFSFGAWLGCSSDDTSSPAGPKDGGTDSQGDHVSPLVDSGGGNDSGGGDAADSAAPTVSCQTYCTTILANCTGANAQYALSAPHTEDGSFSAMAQCMNFCAGWSLGTYNDTNDTVGCRQYHATAAAGDPTHCPPAGPYGGDVCGTRLADFCAAATRLCTTANNNPQQWASAAACEDAAAAYPYQADAGQFDPNDLNHLNCFEYHLREAYTEPDAAEPDDSGDTVAQSHCGDLIIQPDASPQGSCVQ
jgi:hypothetical protein